MKLTLTGLRFGRLVAIRKSSHGGVYIKWECACDCGEITAVRTGHLRSGKIKSCGCLSRELSTHRRRTHGMSKTPEYRAWGHMRERCYDPNNIEYDNYGGRGIEVCGRWRNSFTDFYADVGPRPSRDHSLDRVDSHKNYEPSNCRWATEKQQQRNRRNNVLTEQKASEIMELRRAGCAPSKIADKVGVSRHSVGNVIYNGAWK